MPIFYPQYLKQKLSFFQDRCNLVLNFMWKPMSGFGSAARFSGTGKQNQRTPFIINLLYLLKRSRNVNFFSQEAAFMTKSAFCGFYCLISFSVWAYLFFQSQLPCNQLVLHPMLRFLYLLRNNIFSEFFPLLNSHP